MLRQIFLLIYEHHCISENFILLASLTEEEILSAESHDNLVKISAVRNNLI
jgi:hypothetical protein